MAKVGFWLQGSKGKLSGASLSNGKNGSIIRAIVTPKNPRTDKQMSQRTIFATIAKAASVMKPIINHSFEGIEDGDACIKEFRKLNLYKLRNQAASDIDANLGPDELYAYFAPKGYPFVTPNAYIVSRGSLASPTLQYSGTGITNQTITIASATPTAKEFIEAYLGVAPGEQLSHVFITAGVGSMYYKAVGAQDSGLTCYENAFGARRLVFLPYEGNTAGWNGSVGATSDAIIASLTDLVDTDKSDLTLLEDLCNGIVVTASESSTDYEVSEDFSIDHLVASALIRSKQSADGSWMYSNETLKTLMPSERADYGLPLAEAVKTYTAGVSVGKDNSPFLDEGQNGGTLSMSSFE